MKFILKNLIILMSWLVISQIVYAQGQDPHAGMDMGKSEAKKESASDSSEKNSIIIPPARLQSIGVTYEPVRRQLIEKTIRTVGRIEADERRLVHIHVKFDGWIDKLFVNFTNEEVKKGQALFTVYSPDLVAAQQEYLIAKSAQEILGKNPNAKAARGAQGALESANQRLLLLGIAQKDIDQLKQTGKASRNITMYSPIQGTVINKSAAYVGMHIEPATELYVIADLSNLWILGDIYESELPYIKIGQISDVTMSYLPQEKYQAKIDFIYPTVDAQTRTARVRFEIDNKENKFKPGMYANLVLKIPLGNRLAVPKDAILLTGERAVAFIYHGDGKIEWRDVVLGARLDNLIEVTKGISEGEKIITSANFLIDSESQLKASMGGMQH